MGSSSSPTKSVGIGMRRQPVAPFPGPGSGSSTERLDQVGDSILSPVNSVFSSQSSTTSLTSGGDHEQNLKSHEMHPIVGSDDVALDVEVEITGIDEEDTEQNGSREGSSYGSRDNVGTMNANEQLSNGRSEKNGTMETTGEKEGAYEEEERVGSPQDVAKIEAFHNSLAYHFSTILLSENATEVVSSAQ